MAFTQIPRGPVAHQILVWLRAKNRTTGGTEAVGFWTGPEDRGFTVEGVGRSYFGIGHVLQVPPIVTTSGITVQMQEIVLAATSPEVEAVIRGHDIRHAPVEIHVARFAPDTGVVLGVDRAFKGYVDTAPRKIPAKNETGSEWRIRVASAMRSLTRPLTLKRTDAAQRERVLPDDRPDRFFRYAVVAGRVERAWGAERAE